MRYRWEDGPPAARTDSKPKGLARPSAGAVLLMLILAFILNRLFGAAIARVPKRWFPLGILMAEIVTFGLPCAFFMRRDGDTDVFLFNRSKRGGPYMRSIILGIVAAMLMLGITALWQSFIFAQGINLNRLVTDINYGTVFTSLLVAAVAPAVCEELFFRGALMSAFEPYGGGIAVTLSGLLFAMIHGAFAALPVHLLLGLTLAYVAYASRNIFAPVCVHFAYNATLVLIDKLMADVVKPGEVVFLLTKAETIQIIIQTAIYLLVFLSVLRTLAIRSAVVYAPVPQLTEADDEQPTQAMQTLQTMQTAQTEQAAQNELIYKEAAQKKRMPLMLRVGLLCIFLLLAAAYVYDAILLSA